MKQPNERPMQEAIKSAKAGILAGDGGPFGACIVKDNQIISVAHNTVLRDGDPTAHAEINAIRLAAKQLGSHDLSSCVIYATSEPCPMCLGALFWAQLPHIYVGVSKQVAAEFGFNDVLFYEHLVSHEKGQDHRFEKGMLSDECRQLFDLWRAEGGVLY